MSTFSFVATLLLNSSYSQYWVQSLYEIALNLSILVQFQELFQDVYKFDKNYKFAIEKTFESFVANYDEFAPFPTRPTWALPYTYINFVWDYSFIKVCIFGKILNNAILVVSN